MIISWPDRRRVHATLLGAWVLLVVPTLLWWRASILWVAFMSLYANIASHWGALEGARAQRAAEESGGGR